MNREQAEPGREGSAQPPPQAGVRLRRTTKFVVGHLEKGLLISQHVSWEAAQQMFERHRDLYDQGYRAHHAWKWKQRVVGADSCEKWFFAK